MRLFRFLPLLIILWGSAQAQSPTYGIGRTPSAAEISAWDIAIGPEGEELPAGRGNAEEGAQVYLRKGCVACHGTTGVGGPAPRLVKNDRGSAADPWAWGRVLPIRSPYATTVWDYINRGMPLNQEGTLTPDEVYSLTAYLFFLNDLIEEDEVLDEVSLPKVEMPNLDQWAPLPDWWEPGLPRLLDYPY